MVLRLLPIYILMFFFGCAFGRFETTDNVTKGWIIGAGKLTKESVETISMPKIELDQ